MTILLLNINIGKPWGWGGIESHSEILACALAKKGHHIIMGCWNGGEVTLKSMPATLPARRVTIRNSGDIWAILKLVQISLEEHVDIIIANHGREFWPAAIAANVAHARVILVRHQTDRLKSITCWLINIMVDKIVAVSSAVKDALLRSGVENKKIEVISNGIDLERFNPLTINAADERKKLGIASTDKVVGTVGKLNRGKGVYEVLHAVNNLIRQFPSLKLLFVGEGPERQGLKAEAEKLSIAEKVIFTGVRHDIERMYAVMDVFVLPSTCQEAFGMVIIEAMAMQRPVIGTMVGGISDIIKDEVNGLLIPPGDESALADAIKRYLDEDKFAKKIAFEGRKMVECNFSDVSMGEQFERIFNSIVGASR